MSEEKKDYTQILKRARRRRKRARYLHYAGIGTVLLLLVLCVFFVWKKGGFPALSGNAGNVMIATGSNAEAENPDSEEAAALSVEAEAQDVHVEEAEKQAVVDSYQNLGLVQVSGYLNVRETPGADGNIIGSWSRTVPVRFLEPRGTGTTFLPEALRVISITNTSSAEMRPAKKLWITSQRWPLLRPKS